MKTNNIDSVLIQQYLRGELDRKARHELEKQALDDPFLNDALEGYEMSPAADANISLLQRQLQDRLAVHHAAKKQGHITSFRLSVAAVAAVTFITAGILFWLNQKPEQKTAAASEKTVEATLTPQNSVAQTPAALDTASATSAVIDSASNALIAADMDAARKAAQAKLEQKQKLENNVTANTMAMRNTAPPQTAAADAAPQALQRREETEPAPAAEKAAPVATRSAEPDPEITVTGSGRNARPTVGWNDYRRYISNNTRYPAGATGSGRVVVSAVVKPNGQLTNIRIVRGLEDALNAEAIRVVSSGPSWTGAAKDDEVRINVDFKRPRD